MKWVDINDQTGQIARCILSPEGQITIEAVNDRIREKLERGVQAQVDFKWSSFRPADGENFLRALTSAFTTQALWASPIQLGRTAPPPLNSKADEVQQ